MDDERRHWTGVQSAFLLAARWFQQVVPLAAGRWDHPGLGVWTVRDLVGHTSRALSTVDTYLDKPADHVAVPSAGQYFSRVFAASGDPVAVAQRGRDAGLALGADPVASVDALVETVGQRVQRATGAELVTSPVGGMRLADYLPTRTFELTIHTLDLARCLEQLAQPPAEAASATWGLLGELLIERGELVAIVLLSLTGRLSVPDGFSILTDRQVRRDS